MSYITDPNLHPNLPICLECKKPTFVIFDDKKCRGCSKTEKAVKEMIEFRKIFDKKFRKPPDN